MSKHQITTTKILTTVIFILLLIIALWAIRESGKTEWEEQEKNEPSLMYEYHKFKEREFDNYAYRRIKKLELSKTELQEKCNEMNGIFFDATAKDERYGVIPFYTCFIPEKDGLMQYHICFNEVEDSFGWRKYKMIKKVFKIEGIFLYSYKKPIIEGMELWDGNT